MKYVLKVNRAQLEAISRSLDIVSRLLAGQFQEFHDLFRNKTNIDNEFIEKTLKQLKHEIFPELDEYSSYGIYQEELSEMAKVNYDIYKIIRHFLNQDEHSVHSSPHILLASQEESIQIKTEE